MPAKSRESLEEEWLRKTATVLWEWSLLVWGHCILSSGSQRNQLQGLLCIPERHKGHLNWETETKERVSSWSLLGLCHTHLPGLGYHCLSPLVWILFSHFYLVVLGWNPGLCALWLRYTPGPPHIQRHERVRDFWGRGRIDRGSREMGAGESGWYVLCACLKFVHEMCTFVKYKFKQQKYNN